jgi:hypothetical protein
VPAGTDKRLAQLLGRCFAHDQDQRPTAAQLRAQLDTLLASLQASAPSSSSAAPRGGRSGGTAARGEVPLNGPRWV